VRAPINRVIDWIITKARNFVDKVRDAVDPKVNAAEKEGRQAMERKFKAQGTASQEDVKRLDPEFDTIKKQHGIASLTAVPKREYWSMVGKRIQRQTDTTIRVNGGVASQGGEIVNDNKVYVIKSRDARYRSAPPELKSQPAAFPEETVGKVTRKVVGSDNKEYVYFEPESGQNPMAGWTFRGNLTNNGFIVSSQDTVSEKLYQGNSRTASLYKGLITWKGGSSSLERSAFRKITKSGTGILKNGSTYTQKELAFVVDLQGKELGWMSKSELKEWQCDFKIKSSLGNKRKVSTPVTYRIDARGSELAKHLRVAWEVSGSTERSSTMQLGENWTWTPANGGDYVIKANLYLGNERVYTLDYAQKIYADAGALVRDIKSVFSNHYSSYSANCSGFVKAVAADLGISLPDVQANGLVQHMQANWDATANAGTAMQWAAEGKVVVLGFEATGNGHVAFLLPNGKIYGGAMYAPARSQGTLHYNNHAAFSATSRAAMKFFTPR